MIKSKYTIKNSEIKMKIVILGVGSMGDVRPCANLAKRLITRKHDVTLIAYERFREYIEGEGIKFTAYPGDSEELMHAIISGGSNMFKIMSAVKKVYAKDTDLIRDILIKACTGADLLLYATSTSVAMTYIGEGLKIPYVRLNFYPDAPTKEFRCVNYPEWPLGKLFRGTYNKLSHILCGYFSVRIQKASKKSWLKPLGLKNSMRLGNKYLDGSGIENLLGYSELVVPACEDYGENIHVVGYFSDVGQEDIYTPPADIAEFLAKGEKPIYIGFGSVPAGYDNILKTVLDALKITGKRAFISGSWANIEKEKLPENVHLVGYVPHEWLFSQCEAVVQHGGAGSTANALRAGKPTLVVPFGSDQLFWGNRVYERGLGPKPIHQKKLTAESLAEAINDLCTPEYIERAENIGKLLRAEDGVGRAVHFIEKEYGEQ